MSLQEEGIVAWVEDAGLAGMWLDARGKWWFELYWRAMVIGLR